MSMSTVIKAVFITIICLGALVLTGPGAVSVVHAEDADGFEKGEKDPFELPAIVVTAQKKEEDVQKVPMSIQVVPGSVIEEASISNTKEMLYRMPNIYVRDVGAYQQTIIRGVAGFMNAMYSGVGYYVDDVNIPLVYMQNPDLMDVERVEVLKGPQGALYGRNSESGVINIVTRQPGDTFRGSITGEANFYDVHNRLSPGYSIGTSLSGPVVEDKLYVGFSGKASYTDGFTKNLYDNDKRSSSIGKLHGRLTVRMTPTERWDISFINESMKSDEGFTYGRFTEGPYRTRWHTVNMDSSHKLDRNGNMQALRVKYSGDYFNLLSVTGRNEYSSDSIYDADFTAMPLYQMHMDIHDQLVSQEIRLSSPDDHGPFEWLTGIYVFHEDLNVGYGTRYLAFNLRDKRRTRVSTNGYAVFGQATYTFFDRLHLTAGLRYDILSQTGTQSRQGMVANEQKYKQTSIDRELLPKFSIAYDLTDSDLIYATVSKGYLAGGYDWASATSKSNLRYKPEYTWNYEAGVKTAWFDNRLFANLSIFYIDMHNKQVEEFDPMLMAATVSNAAKARSMGVELDFLGRPMKELEIFGGVGFVDTKVKEWIAPEMDYTTGIVSEYDYSGKRLIYTPTFSYNIGAQYRHDSGIVGRVELIGTGPFYHDVKNELKEPGYEIINVKLGYESENFDISFWCKNVFNTRYENIRFAWGEMGLAAFDGEPRQFGTTITYRF